MILAVFTSNICVLLAYHFMHNMWASMLFILLNAIAVNIAFDRYDKLIRRIEKLERSQDEKKRGEE